MAGKIGSFLLGGVIGAVAGILLAPRSGEETRAIVADKANNVWSEAQEWGAQASDNAQNAAQQAAAKGREVVDNVTAKVKPVIDQVTAKGQEVVNNVTSKVGKASGNVKPVFEEKNDELRDKIEAARQRIAEQVAKNAAESSQAEAKPESVDA